MEKRSNQAEDEPSSLKWSWRLENLDDALNAKSSVSASELIDQMSVTNDTSDYLWYMTR